MLDNIILILVFYFYVYSYNYDIQVHLSNVIRCEQWPFSSERTVLVSRTTTPTVLVSRTTTPTVVVSRTTTPKVNSDNSATHTKGIVLEYVSSNARVSDKVKSSGISRIASLSSLTFGVTVFYAIT